MAKIEDTAGETVPEAAAPKKASSKEVATAEGVDQSYPVLAMDAERMTRVIRANLGNTRMTEFDVDRLKVPSGGGNLWTVPTLEGEESMKSVDGIVVYWKEPRAYWRESFDDSGGGTPPDCQSDDGVRGVGEPGGDCATCPMAKFGTHAKGRGQACKQMRVLFLVRPGEFLPISVSCPPTSLDALRKFFLRLSGKGLLFNHVVVSLSLGSDKNKDGIKYSTVQPSLVRMLNDREVDMMDQYCTAIQPSLEHVRAQVAAGEFAD